MNGQFMSLVKGATLGLMAGVAVGMVGKKMIDENPKMHKKAVKAKETMSNIVDTAQYMFKQRVPRIQSVQTGAYF